MDDLPMWPAAQHELGRDDLEEGMGNLPHVAHVARPLGAFHGETRGSRGHMLWLVAQRKRKEAERREAGAHTGALHTAQAWDTVVLRRGDTMRRPDADSQEAALGDKGGNRTNQVLVEGIMRTAYRAAWTLLN